MIHTRVVLAVIDHASHEYVVLTPDKDVHIDVLDESNEDFVRFFRAGPQGGLPRGVSARNVYAFAPMAPAELALHMQTGRALAEEELRNRGGRDVGGGVGPFVPEAEPAAGAGGPDAEVWALHEFVKGHKIGEEVTVPNGAPQMDGKALVRITDSDGKSLVTMAARVDRAELGQFCEGRIAIYRDAEATSGDDKIAGADARTVSVKYLANGERGRSFKDTVKEYIQVEFDDWPLQPRTCQDYLNAVCEVAESCYTQHLAWVQQRLHPVGGVLLPEAPEHLGLVPPLQGHHGSLYTSMLFAMASCSLAHPSHLRGCQVQGGAAAPAAQAAAPAPEPLEPAVPAHHLPQRRRGRSPAAAWACFGAGARASWALPWALGLRRPQQRARPPWAQQAREGELREDLQQVQQVVPQALRRRRACAPRTRWARAAFSAWSGCCSSGISAFP